MRNSYILLFLLLFIPILNAFSQSSGSEIDSKWNNLKITLIRRSELITEFADHISKSDQGDLAGLKESKEISSELKTDLNNITSIDSLSINQLRLINESLTISFKVVLKKININPSYQNPDKSQKFLMQLEGMDNRIYFEKKEFNKACKENGRIDLLFGSDEYSNLVEDTY